MTETILNAVAVAICTAAALLIVVRSMESKGIRYSIEQDVNGFKFTYRLGVYGGTINLVRDITIKEPEISNHIFGWDCKFPPQYTNDEMFEYIRSYCPIGEECRSHSKDLMIFDEVVNHKNDALISILGVIFVYDPVVHKPV